MNWGASETPSPDFNYRKAKKERERKECERQKEESCEPPDATEQFERAADRGAYGPVRPV